MDLPCSRKVDLNLYDFFSRITSDRFNIPIGEITPDRERFLVTLLRQPGNSVRVDERCFDCLVKDGQKRIVQLISPLRPDAPINKDTLFRGYQDGYWQFILTHPCPSVSLKDLTTVVVKKYPLDAVVFTLSRNKDIRIDDDMLSSAVRRQQGCHGFDIFRLLVDSGRLESDRVSRSVLLNALRKPGEAFTRFTALFLARGWVTPQDDIFRVALKTHFEDGEIARRMCRSYSWLAEQGITAKLSDICDGALFDLRISQLGADAEATVDRYLKFCAENMTDKQYLYDFEEELADAAGLPDSIFPW